jgi:hypothetical protein
MAGKLAVVVSVLCLTAAGAAPAAPTATGPVVAATERPYTLAQVQAHKKLATFGLCDAPQNADDLPTQAVAVQEDNCSYYQHYEATSAAPTNGGSCGGYTLAFGPMGDLKTNWKRHTLKARWGEAALTQAQCPKARLAAVAWGARCLNDACSSTQWEKIDVPLSKAGTWSTNQGRCVLEHQFIDIQHHYKTLNIDVIASYQEGAQSVRKRAHASIHVEKGNGKCASASQGPPPPPPAQAASQIGVSVQPRKP